MKTVRDFTKQIPYIVVEKDNKFKSYGVCNLNLSKPFIDLSKIKIKTTLGKKVNKITRKLVIEIFYGKEKMKKIKVLGQGTFGNVYLYEYNGYTIALKIPNNNIEIDSEINVIEKILPRKICRENIIPLKIIKDQYRNPFVVMQQANGNLREIELLDNRLITKIIIKITEILLCFLKKNIVYLDLKRENVLYKCWGKNISIFLGDLGGFFKLGETSFGGGYFLAPEIIEENQYQVREEHMFYAFGCFIAELYGYREDLGYKDGIKSTKKNIINKYHPKFKKKILKDDRIPDVIKSLILLFTETSVQKRKDNDLNIVFELFNIK